MSFDLPLVNEEDVVVRVIEYGSKPKLLTPARAAAGEAAAVFGELLGRRRFGELCLVVIDWSNELRAQPDEVARPVMFLQLQRFFPEKGRWLEVTGRVDIDEVFAAGVVTRALLDDLANELGEKLAETVREERR